MMINNMNPYVYRNHCLKSLEKTILEPANQNAIKVHKKIANKKVTWYKNWAPRNLQSNISVLTSLNTCPLGLGM